MNSRNYVYIATSIDGYIADSNGGVDWLNETPNPEGSDLGYSDFIEKVDSIIMGRNTFETVDGFDIDWPYTKPVFVLSNSLTSIDEKYTGKVEIVSGNLIDILESLNQKGLHSHYIDGGSTVQSFLKEELIDDLIITTIPVLLGKGIPLFKPTDTRIDFELVSSKIKIGQLVQTHYSRKK